MSHQATLFDRDDATLRARFDQYHADNPEVYRAFCRFADEAIRAGRSRIGAKMLFERIRWHTAVEARSDGFKLNNNYHAFYARMWLADHPGHAGFFELRRQVSE